MSQMLLRSVHSELHSSSIDIICTSTHDNFHKHVVWRRTIYKYIDCIKCVYVGIVYHLAACDDIVFIY